MLEVQDQERPADGSVIGVSGPESGDDAASRTKRRRARAADTLKVRTTQVLIAVIALALWEYLPQVPGVSERTTLLDPFFVSSPTRVVTELIDLATGRNNSVMIWRFVWPTLFAAVIGASIGMSLGALAGLVLSNSPFLSKVFQPYVVALNAIPRIALIPVIIIIAGPTVRAGVFNGIMVTFFVSFFNAFEGGRSVSPHLIHNARILGASRRQVMRYIRAPYVLAWTMAALPLAVTFGLLGVLTGEILTGYGGLGRLISLATITADATRTFAVVIVLSVLGVSVVSVATAIKTRVLHWWGME